MAERFTLEKLIAAVVRHDASLVETMLRAQPELARITVSYGNERRAIHFAVLERDAAAVRLLMQFGADARAGIHPHRDATSAWTLAHERGFDELTAIIEEEEQRRGKPTEPVSALRSDPAEDAARQAVANGDLEFLQERLAQGALANRIDWRDGGLLTVAVENNQPEALALLLDAGFDPNERVLSHHGEGVSYSQGYPLWQAAALGHLELATLLLDRGADPNVHVDSSGSSVHSAYSHKQWQMVALLRARGGLLTADTAAIYRETALARELLKADSLLAPEMLRFAADGGAVEIVRFCLEQIGWPRGDERWFGPLTSPLSFWHHIPWLSAGNKDFDRDGYLACFRLILDRCDPNIETIDHRNILHEIAAMRDWITEDELLAFGRLALAAGTRTDLRDDLLQRTPLGWAKRWNRNELVRLLLLYGARE